MRNRRSAPTGAALAAIGIVLVATAAVAMTGNPSSNGPGGRADVAAAVTLPPTLPPPPSSEPSGVPSASPGASALPVPLADTVAPVVSFPAHSIQIGSFSSVPIKVAWSATDAAGLSLTELRLLTYPGPSLRNITLSSTNATSATIRLLIGVSYRFSVRATDVHGNVSAWMTGPVVRASKVEQNSSVVSYSGTWRTVLASGASGGSYRLSNAIGARVSLAFKARRIGVVVRTGPTLGRIKVYIDGTYVKTISLYSVAARNRILDFSATLPYANHTIRLVRASGTITIDAFVRVAN